MDWIIPVANVAIHALAIWLISIILRLDTVRSLISAVLGVLLANGIMAILPNLGSLTGLLGVVAPILCVTLIAWLLGRDRFKALLAAVLGILLGGFLNSLIMPLLKGLIG